MPVKNVRFVECPQNAFGALPFHSTENIKITTCVVVPCGRIPVHRYSVVILH